MWFLSFRLKKPVKEEMRGILRWFPEKGEKLRKKKRRNNNVANKKATVGKRKGPAVEVMATNLSLFYLYMNLRKTFHYIFLVALRHKEKTEQTKPKTVHKKKKEREEGL